MKIETRVFENGGTIPLHYSKYGDNVSPPLTFVDVPDKTRSLVFIMDDRDAPDGLFTHWVLFNIGPAVRELPEDTVPADARQGKNGWGEACYGGPRPPDREHRYFFRLFALDLSLTLPEGASREEVERAMQGHIIARAEYMGRHAPHVTTAP
jgi:Raf kinase inhibitor-like YbhB/YbcL family protein